MTVEESIRRCDNAKRLLEDPLLVSAFESLKDRWVHDWLVSLPSSREEREDIWRRILVLERVQGELKSFVDDGSITKSRLKAVNL